MSRDPHDALIEQLLRESMGGDRPRDLTPRVMALAKAYDRTRRSWWISAGAAMAASIVIVVGLSLLFWSGSYPAPVIDGITLVNGGSSVQRGAQLATDDQEGSMLLGGYATVWVGPDTTFTLGGDKKKEVVFLDEGKLSVAVKKNRGSFDVVVDEAVVHVTGTKFDVDVKRGLNEKEEWQKKMRVFVHEGSVDVTIDGGKEKITLHQDESWEGTVSSTALQRLQGQAEINPSSPDAAIGIAQDLESPPTAAPDAVATTEIRKEEPRPSPAVIGGLDPSPSASVIGQPGAARDGARGREAVAAPGRGADARGADARGAQGRGGRDNMMDPKLVPMYGVRGTGMFRGRFQKAGNFYVLNTGRFLLLLGTGSEDIPRGAPTPGPNSVVRVQFSNGKLTSIVPIPPAAAEKVLNKNK